MVFLEQEEGGAFFSLVHGPFVALPPYLPFKISWGVMVFFFDVSEPTKL
jgi:hypothetical protein